MIIFISLSIYPDSIYQSRCWTNRILAFAADLYYVIHDEKGRIFDVALDLNIKYLFMFNIFTHFTALSPRF